MSGLHPSRWRAGVSAKGTRPLFPASSAAWSATPKTASNMGHAFYNAANIGAFLTRVVSSSMHERNPREGTSKLAWAVPRL
jgi:hypothetical protein